MQNGDTFGRYGNPTGSYGTETGASIDKLSLPPNSNTSIYTEYQVVKPIPNVTQAIIAPWGGSSGGGIQFKLSLTIQELLDGGYIIELP